MQFRQADYSARLRRLTEYASPLFGNGEVQLKCAALIAPPGGSAQGLNSYAARKARGHRPRLQPRIRMSVFRNPVAALYGQQTQSAQRLLPQAPEVWPMAAADQ